MNPIQLLAVISGEDLLQSVIEIIIIGVCFGLVVWLIGWVGLPEPFAKVAKVILGIAAVVFLINALMGFAGHSFIVWRH